MFGSLDIPWTWNRSTKTSRISSPPLKSEERVPPRRSTSTSSTTLDARERCSPCSCRWKARIDIEPKIKQTNRLNQVLKTNIDGVFLCALPLLHNGRWWSRNGSSSAWRSVYAIWTIGRASQRRSRASISGTCCISKNITAIFTYTSNNSLLT